MKRGTRAQIALLSAIGVFVAVVVIQRHSVARNLGRMQVCRREVFGLSMLIREHLLTAGTIPGTDGTVQGGPVDPARLWHDVGSNLTSGDHRLLGQFLMRNGVPVDPWGVDYWFRVSRGPDSGQPVMVRIGSCGPDGHDDNGANDDIIDTIEYVPVDSTGRPGARPAAHRELDAW